METNENLLDTESSTDNFCPTPFSFKFEKEKVVRKSRHPTHKLNKLLRKRKKNRIENDDQSRNIRKEKEIEENNFIEFNLDKINDKQLIDRLLKVKPLNADDRDQGPSCNCSKKCFTLFSDSERQTIFAKFWELKTSQEQTLYILSCLRFEIVNNESENKKSSKRQFKKLQRIQFIININNQPIKICRTAFLNLHGFFNYDISRIIKKVYKTNEQITNENCEKNEDLLEARFFIQNSLEFKSCVGRNNVRGCFKKYSELFTSQNKNVITEYKFRQIFNEEMQDKMKRLCRMCLVLYDDIMMLADIFTFDEFNISNAVWELASVKIEKEEVGMPHLICKSCVKNLNNSLNFKRLCIESDKILLTDTFKNDLHEKQLKLQITIKNETGEENQDFYLPEHDDNSYPEDDKHEIVSSKLIENQTNEYKIKKHVEYNNLKDKLVNPHNKTPGPPCKCPKMCYSLFSKSMRDEIFNRFWKIKRLNKQYSYLHDCVQSTHVKRRRGLEEMRKKLKMNPNYLQEVPGKKRGKAKRFHTIVYKIPINNIWVRVCAVAFRNLHGIKRSKLDRVLNKKKIETLSKPEPDRTKRKKYTKRKQDENGKIETGDDSSIEINESNDKQDKNDSEEDSSDDDEDVLEPKYECQICKTVFNKKVTFYRHKNRFDHYTENDRIRQNRGKKYKQNAQGQYVCPDCGRVFPKKKTCSNHWSKVHNTHSYTCEVCGDAFNFYRQFYYHKEKHKYEKNLTGNNEQKKMKTMKTEVQQQDVVELLQQQQSNLVSCDICGKNCFNMDILKKHKLIHFENRIVIENNNRTNPTYTCHFCGTLFFYPNLLNEHILLMHYHN